MTGSASQGMSPDCFASLVNGPTQDNKCGKCAEEIKCLFGGEIQFTATQADKEFGKLWLDEAEWMSGEPCSISGKNFSAYALGKELPTVVYVDNHKVKLKKRS